MKTLICAGLVALTSLAVQAQGTNWETVSIPGICTYQIPPTLEIQAGKYKTISDQFHKKILEITHTPDSVVAQPKGINVFNQKALKRYCRVMVETRRGKAGDNPKLDEPMAVSAADLREVNESYKSNIYNSAAALKGMKMKILSWLGTKVARVNGVDAILATYTRSVNDAEPVMVRMYTIANNDAVHTITISYRESERQLWANDLNKVVESFKFKKR